MLQQDMQEAIKKNLPSEVGDILRSELESGRTAKETVEALHSDIVRKDKEISLEKFKVEELSKKVKTDEELGKRETDVRERENNLKVSEAEAKRVAAEEKAAAVLEIVRIVFRSPVYTEHINKSVPVGVAGNNNCSGFVGSGQETGTVTRHEQ